MRPSVLHQPLEVVLRPKQYLIAADEFFPIFIFVLVSTPLTLVETKKALMWDLCGKGLLQAEAGYYLTIFTAAVEYVRGT